MQAVSRGDLTFVAFETSSSARGPRLYCRFKQCSTYRD